MQSGLHYLEVHTIDRLLCELEQQFVTKIVEKLKNYCRIYKMGEVQTYYFCKRKPRILFYF